MQQSTIFLIQCLVFIIIIIALYYHFNKKLCYQLSAIESLQNQILEQQRYIENHDKLLRSGRSINNGGINNIENLDFPIHSNLPPLNSMNHLNSVRPIHNFPQHVPGIIRNQQDIPTNPPNLVNPLLNIAPMMSGLMGVLSNIQPPHNTTISGDDTDEEIDKLDENELDKELKEELAELKDKTEDIKEGRIDEKNKELTKDKIVEDTDYSQKHPLPENNII